MGLGVIWMEDKVSGLDDRDYVIGVTLWHRLIAHMVTQSFMTFAQIGIFFGLLCGVYDMAINGSWVPAVSLVYVTALCGLTIGNMQIFHEISTL